MHSIHHQQGMSAIGWLIAISIFGFLVFAGSKIIPHYIDNQFVVSTLKTLAEDPEFSTMTAGEIKSKLRKFFTINNVRGQATRSVTVKKVKNGNIVTIGYEERIDFFYNVDVVLSFHSYLDSRQPHRCCRPPK